jgi:hypothetical protein
MPSYKELQKEMIRKNDQILRICETNNNLRDSNAKLTLENKEYKERNENLYYKVRESERVMLTQDKQIEKLRDRNKELLNTACKNEDIAIVLHDGTKKVFSIDSLVREYSNLYMESMEGLPLGKRTVSYISNGKAITKTVSGLLDDYLCLLKEVNKSYEDTPLGRKTVLIKINGENLKFSINSLITDYVRISKQLAYMCVPDPKSSVLRELATENDKLNTEIDMYKSAINDLYNLAAGEKGYL